MLLRRKQVRYPDSSGAPMPENDVMRLLMLFAEAALRQHYLGRPDVYVSANHFIYYVEGDPRKRVAPDLYVVVGVEARDRPNYKIWEEGKAPDVVFEFTSASSRYSDMGEKLGLYAALGIPEYYVFDPAGQYLEPRFRAFRLEGQVYREIETGEGVASPGLGLRLLVENQRLRFQRADGSLISEPDELVIQVEALRTLAEHEALRADNEALRADAEARRAQQETERALQLEDEVRILRARLDEPANG